MSDLGRLMIPRQEIFLYFKHKCSNAPECGASSYFWLKKCHSRISDAGEASEIVQFNSSSVFGLQWNMDMRQLGLGFRRSDLGWTRGSGVESGTGIVIQVLKPDRADIFTPRRLGEKHVRMKFITNHWHIIFIALLSKRQYNTISV